MERTAVYINERLVGYCSPLWRAVRAEIFAEEGIAQLERNSLRCAPSSFDRKASSYLRKFEGVGRFNMRESSKAVLIVLRTEFNKKVGSSSRRIEFLFSILRMLGLKMPYRASPSAFSFGSCAGARDGKSMKSGLKRENGESFRIEADNGESFPRRALAQGRIYRILRRFPLPSSGS